MVKIFRMGKTIFCYGVAKTLGWVMNTLGHMWQKFLEVGWQKFIRLA